MNDARHCYKCGKRLLTECKCVEIPVVVQTELEKLRAIAAAACSVLSEDGVKEYLSAYVMGVELIDRLDKL